MRNPRRWRSIGLAFLGTGAVAAITAFAVPPGAAGDTLRACLFIYGISAILFGGISALLRHLEVRAAEALARGEGVIGRWHLDAEAWRRFLAADQALRRAPGALPNDFEARDDVPAAGVDVIASAKAVSVDGSIHPLNGVAQVTDVALHPAGDGPAMVEFQMYVAGGGYGAAGVQQSPKRSVLRFPVAAGAELDAARLVAVFDGSAPRKPDFFHGKGDGSDAEDLNTCWNCGYATHQLRGICPKCGSQMQTRRWSRRLGILVMLCGLFLTTMMATILRFMAPMLLHPGVEYGTSRFTGSATLARSILLLLVAVLAFGVIALGYGVWQIATGKRNKKVVGVMVGIVSVLMVVAWTMQALGK